MMTRTVVALIAIAMLVAFSSLPVRGQEGVEEELSPQMTCPVTGLDVDWNLFVDYHGKRIFVCSQECIAVVSDDPEKAIATLAERGESVVDVPPSAGTDVLPPDEYQDGIEPDEELDNGLEGDDVPFENVADDRPDGGALPEEDMEPDDPDLAHDE